MIRVGFATEPSFVPWIKLSSGEGNRLPEAQQLGEERAQELAGRLANLSVSNEEYFAHRERLESNRHDMPTIDAVVVENESRLSPNSVLFPDEVRAVDRQ